VDNTVDASYYTGFTVRQCLTSNELRLHFLIPDYFCPFSNFFIKLGNLTKKKAWLFRTYWVLFRTNGVLQFYERSYYYYFGIKMNTLSMFFHQRKIVNPVFKHDYYITQHEIPIIIILVATQVGCEA
jgi:hypothetical protein